MSTNENEVPVEEVVLNEQQLGGFDIEGQQQLAKLEDEGVPVHIDSAQGLPMFYKDRNGEVRPVTITIAGTNSSRYRRAEEAQRKRKVKSAKLTHQKLHDDQFEKVVACVISFEGFLSQGQEVQFTPGNVRMILKACPWILDQLLEAMGDHERFI